MKKYISKFYVLLVFAFILTSVGCGKADTTKKVEFTIDSSVDKSINEEIGTTDNTGSSGSTEIADNAETTDNKEPVATSVQAVATVTVAPVVTTESTVTPTPTVTTEPTVTAEPTATTESTATTDTEPLEITETLEPTDPTTSSTLEKIEETVLFDRDGIRVTAKELTRDFWGKCISVLVENDTDKNIGIMSTSFIVNNYMSTNFTFSSVAPHTDSNDSISLEGPDIIIKGISTISEVAVSFLVFDNDSGNNLFVTEEVSIPTSAYGTVEQTLMVDGKELVNQDGIQIIGKYVDENSSWGTGVLLYLKNTTDGDILVQCDDMTVNGISIFPFFSGNVNKGREALEAIQIMDFDLTDNNITEIKDIELKFSVIDTNSNNTIYAYEPFQISVGE